MALISDILLIPTLTLMALSLSLAPLGCFLVWRRLAFFGDGMSHACTFGIAIALFLKIHFLGGILLTAVLIAGILFLIETRQDLSTDTLFSLISYSFFAAGIVALSLIKSVHINIEDILFGDFLAIQGTDFLLGIAISIIAVIVLVHYWPILLLTCLSPDLATIMHPHAKRANVTFILATALVVAFGMYLIGALLLPALMILPAASARALSRGPKQMILLSLILSVVGCTLGICAAYVLNTPPSATMVLMSSFIFSVSLMVKNV
jgi:zinc transport system permease protein